MEAFASPEIARTLKALARTAEEHGSPLYLVGGAVRDRLLGREVGDLDLVAEGPVGSIARAVAAELGAEVEVHQPFGTAKLRLKSAEVVDLATARREVYEEPASLPRVEPASLGDDLERRDFTVNSIAMPLAMLLAVPLDLLDYASLIDPFGGLADIEARRLRVHHERSFMDDPTRILRGVRLEARLGLGLDSDAERWAGEATSRGGSVERLSGTRLANELARLFRERVDLESSWLRLEELGFLKAAGLPGGGTARSLAAVALAADSWSIRYPRTVSPVREDACFLCIGLASPRGGNLLSALQLGSRLTSAVAPTAQALELLQERDGSMGLEVVLSGLPIEGLVCLEAAAGGAHAKLVESHVDRRVRSAALRLVVDGEILVNAGFPPGPSIGAALAATREARLEGRIESHEELAYAVNFLKNDPSA